MSKSPYFSILLPTKNRALLVDYAVRSVLQQDFTDYELIICDNDDDPDTTRNVVEPYLNDERIKYIRTGGLDMICNWNSALEAGSGRFVTVLGDKMIFYPGALLSISRDIKVSPTGVVVWRTDVNEDGGAVPVLIRHLETESTTLDSVSVLNVLSTNIWSAWTVLPRGLCCVVPRSIINTIMDQTGTPFYEEVSPDFVSAIKVLRHVDKYLLSGAIYTMISSSTVGNGRGYSRRKSKDHSYFMGSQPLNVDLTPCYLKSDRIVSNALISDFISQCARSIGRPGEFVVSNRAYFEMLFRELVVNSRSERKVLWSWDEIWKLLSGGDGLISNTFYALLLLLGKYGRRTEYGIDGQSTAYSREEFRSNSGNNPVDDYLNGTLLIDGRGGF